MKVSELIALWSKKANLTPTCYTRYVSLIKVIDSSSISHLDIKKLTHKTSQAFIDSLVSLGELSLSSIEQIKIILNSAFRYAVLNDLLDANPCSELKVEGHKEKKASRASKVYLSDDEMEKITDSMTLDNLEVLIPLFTGLTAGEIVALKWQDVDFEKKTIYTHRIATWLRDETSGKQEMVIKERKYDHEKRVLPMPDKLAELLKVYKAAGDNAYLYGNANEPMRNTTINNRALAIMRNLGIRQLGIQGLRDTFIIRRIMDKTPLDELIRLTGYNDERAFKEAFKEFIK